MLLLLQACFGSWRLAALSLLTPLIAVAGGVLAARIAGGTLSLGSCIGLFAVFGIAMRNGVLLVSRYRHLEHDEAERFRRRRSSCADRETGSRPIADDRVCRPALIALTFVVIGSVPGQELRASARDRRPRRSHRRDHLDAVRRARALSASRRPHVAGDPATGGEAIARSDIGELRGAMTHEELP